MKSSVNLGEQKFIAFNLCGTDSPLFYTTGKRHPNENNAKNWGLLSCQGALKSTNITTERYHWKVQCSKLIRTQKIKEVTHSQQKIHNFKRWQKFNIVFRKCAFSPDLKLDWLKISNVFISCRRWNRWPQFVKWTKGVSFQRNVLFKSKRLLCGVDTPPAKVKEAGIN